jgi:hypothetical protein
MLLMEPLANNSLKPCEICMGDSGTQYCLHCDSISAETVNHCIKDKTFQEIINNVPHKNNTLVSQFLIAYLAWF